MRRKNKSTRPLAKALSAFFVAFLMNISMNLTTDKSYVFIKNSFF